MDTRDATTTPRWLQVPGVALLSAAVLYFTLCFAFIQASSVPAWTWGARWKMFSARSHWHYKVEGEAQLNGEWHAFDPETYFPYRWESGPRFARSAFFRNNHRMKVLAAATCTRWTDGNPERVRYNLAKWRATPGQLEQPRKRLTTTRLVDWRCGTSVSLPQGVRL